MPNFEGNRSSRTGKYPSTLTHTDGLVSGSSIPVATANEARNYIRFDNHSTINSIFLRLGEAAILNEGIKLFPGGHYEMSVERGNLYVGEIRAIATGASTPMTITEA